MKEKLLGLCLVLVFLIGGISMLEEMKLISIWGSSSTRKENGDKRKKLASKKLKGLSAKNLYINQAWRQDFQKMMKKGQLPSAWLKISRVMYIPTDPATQELSKLLRPPVKIVESGTYRLEVTIISHQSDDYKTKIILQNNLVDSETDDTIWEHNKTYSLFRE